MAHQFFEDLKRDPCIEQMGRKGMAQTVRRIMACETSGREILIHQDINLGPEEV